MCGLCGKLNFDTQRPVDSELIDKMMAVILHRGPDGGGHYLSGPVGLGHRRLSIIDIESGIQPMSNEDGSIWVVYNGEIYNFQELRKELLGKGHRFKTASDTEVIVHLYEELGDQCVIKFQGMFAFALWDGNKQRLLLARDRVGIKPLYYTNTGQALVFGSEIKSLLVDPTVDRRINAKALDRFLTYYYLPGTETLFDKVNKLEPGHYLVAEKGRVTVSKYWDLGFDPDPSPLKFDDAVADLSSLLAETVKNHMISDVPVGVLLSGGVDSSGVLSYAVEQSGRPIHTFTMGFAGERFQDERPYARLAAEKFGTIHQDISLDSKKFDEFLPRFVWHMEEPVCEPPAIALFHVTQLAKNKGVKVLLSGEGGDEAFGGYQTYRNLLILEKLKSAFSFVPGGLALGFGLLRRLGLEQFGQYAHLSTLSLQDYYLSRTATPFTPFNREKPELYNSDFVEALKGINSNGPTRHLFLKTRELPMLSQMLYVDTKTWLPDDLLVKADKMSMAASVELRVPLLDHKVLEFAAKLPQHFKVSGWQLKRILKQALLPKVPTEILNRKKTGFPVPYDSWMRTELKEFVHDTLSRQDAFHASFLNKATVDNIMQNFYQGNGYAKEVFSLLILELWHQQFAAIGDV